jgi:exodeoxyribonuclease-5
MQYTKEQQNAIDFAVKQIKNNCPLIRISGAAGTGKSTILKEILGQVGGMAACAYTGQAADVLRRKGISATTIHQRIYKWVEEYEIFERIWDVPYKGFAIDEGSMVGCEILKDISSYGIPILAIGDPYQLEPVKEEDSHLMRDADLELIEVHRQARDNPIIDLATKVRLGQPWGVQSESKCRVKKGKYTLEELLECDIVVCGFNKTRVGVNSKFRKHYGFKELLEVGDKIVIRSNDKDLGVFNGQSCKIVKIIRDSPKYITADLEFDSGDTRQMQVDKKGFNVPKKHTWPYLRTIKARCVYADYGYCRTCHTVQGGQWDTVGVIDEQWSKAWEPARWRYTSFTRAIENLKVWL